MLTPAEIATIRTRCEKTVMRCSYEAAGTGRHNDYKRDVSALLAHIQAQSEQLRQTLEATDAMLKAERAAITAYAARVAKREEALRKLVNDLEYWRTTPCLSALLGEDSDTDPPCGCASCWAGQALPTVRAALEGDGQMPLVSVLMAESEDDAKRWVEEIAHYDISERGRPDRRLHPTYQRRDGIWSVMVSEAEEDDALGIIEDASLDGLAMSAPSDVVVPRKLFEAVLYWLRWCQDKTTIENGRPILMGPEHLIADMEAAALRQGGG